MTLDTSRARVRLSGDFSLSPCCRLAKDRTTLNPILANSWPSARTRGGQRIAALLRKVSRQLLLVATVSGLALRERSVQEVKFRTWGSGEASIRTVTKGSAYAIIEGVDG